MEITDDIRYALLRYIAENQTSRRALAKKLGLSPSMPATWLTTAKTIAAEDWVRLEPLIKRFMRGDPVENLSTAALDAIAGWDAWELDGILERARAQLNPLEFIDMVTSFYDKLLRAQEAKTMTTAHEHLATPIIQSFMMRQLRCARGRPAGVIAVASMGSQRHSGGALAAGYLAAVKNWDVLFLGSAIPVDDLLSCAQASRIDALAVSITDVAGNKETGMDIYKLTSGLQDSQKRLFFGGRTSFGDVVQTCGHRMYTAAEFYEAL